jgi:cobalt/nickel transport system ATP-binding protein
MGDTLFELDSVGYTYNPGRIALRNITLKIEERSSVAVLGANGSGKTTLLKILDGLVLPTSGSVRAFGMVLSDAALELNRSDFARYFRSRVGMVFQDADSQLFSPVVREEVAFAPLQQGLSQGETERRVKDALLLLGIVHLQETSPQSLSEGEKRKVAIASVLSGNPDVLLMDEPSSDLDPRSKVWLQEFLAELHGTGKTIVTATHDLELASETSDICVVLDEQHGMAAIGRTSEILDDLDLLLKANLIHEHAHRHGSIFHIHPHAHAD